MVRVVSYGEAPDADLRITEIELQGTTASATLREGTASWPLELQVPGRYNLATAGIGSGVHVAAELFRSTARVEIEPVHYRGGGPSVAALVAGASGLTKIGNVGVDEIVAVTAVGCCVCFVVKCFSVQV